VLEGSLRRFYAETLGAAWRELPEMKKLLQDAHRGNMKRPSEAASNDLLATASTTRRSPRTCCRCCPC